LDELERVVRLRRDIDSDNGKAGTIISHARAACAAEKV
jgi:hypothetical protein